MARNPRVHLPEAPLHIIQRGHNRAPCFFTEGDYHVYLDWLREALTTTGISLHAYVLMTNHVHMLITPHAVEGVPRLVMSLGRRYVQYINRRHGRTGTLWDSRYKSCLVQSESYLLACQRYIELNPVRAAIVADPAQYRWSSYRFHAFGQFDALLTPRAEYLALGDDARERQEAYRKLFDCVLSEEVIGDIRKSVFLGRPLGSGPFQTMVERTIGTRRESRRRGRPRKLRCD